MNQKIYVPVEVARDRNGRIIYTPIITTETPKISFGAETRTSRESEAEDNEQLPKANSVTEVEYPHVKRINKKIQDPDVKIKLNKEVINKRARCNQGCNKQHQLYRSCLTKRELLELINEEIKLDEDQSINLVEIINQATLTENPQQTEEDMQDDWEKKAEEIRSELKRAWIVIDSKGLAECR